MSSGVRLKPEPGVEGYLRVLGVSTRTFIISSLSEESCLRLGYPPSMCVEAPSQPLPQGIRILRFLVAQLSDGPTVAPWNHALRAPRNK